MQTHAMTEMDINISKLEMAAGKLRAISHPMRIAIINLLEGGRKLSVTEIYEALDIEQATASHHLNILKNKGVLVSKREGKKIFYQLQNVALTEIIECINRCNEE
ncbi:MAG: metalloregulator ArsR/SmtB family transcription factor [bacterium]|jgi:DNA-binding transcriptional ArsR family regulator